MGCRESKSAPPSSSPSTISSTVSELKFPVGQNENSPYTEALLGNTPCTATGVKEQPKTNVDQSSPGSRAVISSNISKDANIVSRNWVTFNEEFHQLRPKSGILSRTNLHSPNKLLNPVKLYESNEHPRKSPINDKQNVSQNSTTSSQLSQKDECQNFNVANDYTEVIERNRSASVVSHPLQEASFSLSVSSETYEVRGIGSISPQPFCGLQDLDKAHEKYQREISEYSKARYKECVSITSDCDVSQKNGAQELGVTTPEPFCDIADLNKFQDNFQKGCSVQRSSESTRESVFSSLSCDSEIQHAIENMSLSCDSENSLVVDSATNDIARVNLTMQDRPEFVSPKQKQFLLDNPAQNTMEPSDLDLLSLAPLCEVSDKEIVSMEKEICGVKKDKLKLDDILYLTIAFGFFQLLPVPLSLLQLCDAAYSCFTEQMISGVNRMLSDTRQGKVKIILLRFKELFHIAGMIASRKDGAEKWLQNAFLVTLKNLLETCVEEGQKSLVKLCTILESTLGRTSIPLINELSTEAVEKFISTHVKSLRVVNDAVFIVPKTDTSFSGLSTSQSSQKNVVIFFKEFLKSSAMPCEELSLALSKFKPELLATLVERNYSAVLNMLIKDGSFKSEKGMVMLKGYSPVVQPVPQESKPLASPSSENRADVICSCCSGIVMCVGKSRATFWCSYSQTCKNVFVIARRSQTVVDTGVGENFQNVFREEDRVIFTTQTVSSEGWEIEFACVVKIVPEKDSHSVCLCSCKVKMNIFHQKMHISNGIPFSNNFTFFWNCKGTLINIKGSKGIVKCMLNEGSDRYFLVYFTNSMWFVGCDVLNTSDLSAYLQIGEKVEVDINMMDFRNSGFLTWFCVCLRKQQTEGVWWNCTGRVEERQAEGFKIRVISKNFKKQFPGISAMFAPLQNWYLSSDGSFRTLSQSTLQVNDQVTFDVETDNPSVAKFIRKCKRPTSVKLPPLNDPAIVLAVVKSEMNEDNPLFENIFANSRKDPLTLHECKDIQEAYLQADLLLQRHMIDSLSTTSDSYYLNVSGALQSVKNTTCQTTSTGPVFSALLPL